jgi:hypothetical protein
MLARLAWLIFPAVLATVLGAQVAHADVYTWVDATGKINVSNLTPPNGAHVTNVVHDDPAKSAARAEAARAAANAAEVQQLSERVRQLESDLDSAKQQPPAHVAYVPMPPPAIPYAAAPAPPPVPYAVDAPPASTGCDYSSTDCGLWWVPGIYPGNVVAFRGPRSGRHFPAHGRNHFGPQRPMPVGGPSHRR